MNILTVIDFHASLEKIKEQLINARKESFDPDDRIIISQSSEDTYSYIDAPGDRLIEIQQLVDDIDITNCFILIRTSNPDIKLELEELVSNYTYQTVPFEFSIHNGIYNKQVKQYSNTSCTKLWNHLYINPEGKSLACCYADARFPVGDINNPRAQSQQLKEWVTQGYRIRTCQRCYQDEDHQLVQRRRPADYSTETPDFIRDVDIRISNLCNFKCRMCSEEYSSAIQAETVELYGNDAILGTTQFSLNRPNSIERSNRFEQIKPYITKNLTSIYFAGGEPLITQEHYKILDWLIDIGHTELSISYNTNLSTLNYKGNSIFNYWKQFKNIRVGASIDCCDAAAEYIRHGTIWTDIEQNIEKIQEHTPHVKLQFTSIASSIGSESLIKFQKQYINRGFDQTQMQVNVLTHPHFLSVAALPKHHKKRLSDIIQQHITNLGKSSLAYQWNVVLQYMNNYDYSYSLREFKKRMKVLDKHRNESFVETFPQFSDLYD